MRFDPFLQPVPEKPSRGLGDKIALLDGIGDKKLREAQDYLWSIGIDAPLVSSEWRPAAGELVAYGLPDGSTRVGSHLRMEGRDALVHADSGTVVSVPLEYVQPATSDAQEAFHRRRLASVMSPVSELRETREAIDMGEGYWSLSLSYPLGRKPPVDEVNAWVKGAYRDVEIVDGDDQIPGRIALVVHRRHPEAEGIDEQKLAEEELDKCAQANPAFEFVPGAFEQTDAGGVLHFDVCHAGSPVFVRQGSWTATLAEDAALCTGCVFVEQGTVTVRVAAYESGHGPFSMHFDDPKALDDGSYVVRGSDEKEAAPPPMSQLTQRDYERQKQDFENAHSSDEEKAKQRRKMIQKDRERQQNLMPSPPAPGEHIESIGGPGLHMAVDESAKDYWTTYFGEYGRSFTEDKVAMIRTAWHEAGKGEPTTVDVGWVLSVTRHVASFAKQADDPITRGTERGQKRRKQLIRRAEEPQATPAPAATPAAPAGAGGPNTAPATAPIPPKPAADKASVKATDLTGVANALIQAMSLTSGARTAVEGLITKAMARMPDVQRRALDPNDPGTIQRLLPQALETMNPKQLEALVYQYAPQVQLVDESGQPVGSGFVNKLKRFSPWSDQKTTRQQVEYGQRTQKTMEGYQPPGMTPSQAPATPDAPAAPAAPAAATLAPAPADSAAGVAQPPGTMKVKLPAGTKVVLPSGETADFGNSDAFVPFKTKAAREEDSGSWSDSVAGNLPLAQGERRFEIASVWREGRYAKAVVQWDPESLRGMNPGAVIQAVKSFVLAASTWKDRFDLGFISRPILCALDCDVGMAEVRFRSSNIEGFMPMVKEESAS